MTSDQIDLVQRSFAEVLRQKSDAGMVFYERLFAIAPEVKPLFKSDMASQQRKLMDTLAVAVGSLRDMPTLVVVLADLGRRHDRYGVQRKHYASVGEALLWTFATILGPYFDERMREAWTTLYAKVVCAMTTRPQLV